MPFCLLALLVIKLGIFSLFSCDQKEIKIFTPEVITEYWTSGQTLPLEPTPAGNVRLEAIGDYIKPLVYLKEGIGRIP